jgi:hypothetical protein
MKRIMHETAMNNKQTTTSKRQLLRSWRTFRRKIAQALPSLLFGLAVGILHGCGDGGGNINTVAAGTNTAALSWDANSESNLAGYKIYYGVQSGNFTTVVDVGLTATPTTPQYIVTVPVTGTTYYFTVTAYDTDGNESATSDEVSKSI